jgi:hypothetical protein
MKDPRLDPLLPLLHVHPDFLTCDIALLFTICNGCGAKGSRFRPPKTMWFLSIEIACQLHDFDWHHGKTEADRRRADQRFLLNMLIIIEEKSQNRITRGLRTMRAAEYYSAVRDFGDDAYWAGKEQPPEVSA